MIIRTKALVIKENIVGESDKYITLFTKELGKIQVLAQKAKKADKGFASATQLFVYGDFMLASYKDTYRLVNVDIIEMFHNIRNHLSALSYASYIIEFVQYVTEPNLPQNELLHLTLVTLKVLSKRQEDFRHLRRVYELRALGVLGLMLQLECCIECGECVIKEEKATYYISAKAGGVVCACCKKVFNDVCPVSYSTLFTMHYILNASLKELYHFQISPNIQEELDRVCTQYVQYYVDKTFKTLDFIDRTDAL